MNGDTVSGLRIPMKTFSHLALIFLAGTVWLRTAHGEGRLSLAERFSADRMAVSVRQAGADAVLSWSVSGEAGWVGFDVYRSSGLASGFTKVNSSFLANTFDFGGRFEYRDAAPGFPGVSYEIEMVFTDGSRFRSEPVSLDFLPFSRSDAKAGGPTCFTAFPDEVPPPPSPPAVAPEIQKASQRRSQVTGDRVKIVVKEEGVYRLSADELAGSFGAAVEDVKTWISQDFLRLSSQGAKCSWVPDEGNEGLFFYNPGHETLYTAHNVFWLERESLGEVIPPVPGSPPAGGEASASFLHTACYEEQKRQEFARFYPDLEDYWFWFSMQAGNPASNVVFFADRIEASGPDAELELCLQGGSNSGVSNEHHVAVSVNGTVVGHSIWEKNTPDLHRFDVSVSLLTNGFNTLTLRAVLDDGIPYSTVYLDRFRLSYRMLAKASNGYLRIPAAEATEWRVSGFTNSGIHVIEILDAHRIRAVEDVQFEAAEGGTTAVRFGASTHGNSGYAVFSSQGARTPAKLEGAPASSLRSTTNRVDYLLITHPVLETQVRRLAEYRADRQPGLQTRVVLMDDIYNEFSFGIETPEAIRRFLAYAYAYWQQRPEYVLFGGGGSFDYKNYLGYADNLVTCLRVDTPYGLFSSDNTLADVEGQDGEPEFSIGRISSSTLESMSNVVSKIIARETNNFRTNLVLLAADNPDEAGDFWATVGGMTNRFPSSYAFTNLFLTANEANVTQARNALRASFNSGLALMLYFGHASWNRLSTSGLWRLDDMPGLSNFPRLPIVVTMACWPNRFEFPGYVYIGESFVLTPSHGAVATWGPSGESLNVFAQTYTEYLLDAFKSNPALRLGTLARLAAQRANAAGVPRFMRDGMTLIGDPMTPVDVP